MEFINKFLSWLNYEDLEGGKVAAPRRLLLEAPKTAFRIPQHSLPSPERLREVAAEFQTKQQRQSEEQYHAFLHLGFADFLNWLETQVERSAESGGLDLPLTFDNVTGIVVAAMPRQRGGPVPYAVPLSHTAVQRLAYAVAEHFRKSDFQVRVERSEGNDLVDIDWTENATLA